MEPYFVLRSRCSAHAVDTNHSSQRPLTHGLASVDRFEEEDLFLKVRREIRKVEDLGEPRPS